MNVRPALFYLLIVCVLGLVFGFMQPVPAIILIVFAVWCLILADSDAGSHRQDDRQ